jgi:hypothetical protein
MANLSMADMISRTTPMAEPAKKKNWIKKEAPKERRGVFKEKAKEERPAEDLMGMSHKRKKKSPLYDRKD